jgi:acetolactate synthase-1/2/3 large subunit
MPYDDCSGAAATDRCTAAAAASDGCTAAAATDRCTAAAAASDGCTAAAAADVLQVPRKLIGTDGFQETPIVEVTRAITKHNYLVMDIADLPRVIKEVSMTACAAVSSILFRFFCSLFASAAPCICM